MSGIRICKDIPTRIGCLGFTPRASSILSTHSYNDDCYHHDYHHDYYHHDYYHHDHDHLLLLLVA